MVLEIIDNEDTNNCKCYVRYIEEVFNANFMTKKELAFIKNILQNKRLNYERE